MFVMNLNINQILFISRKLISHFIKSHQQSCAPNGKRRIEQIQIILEQQDDFYRVQIMYCGEVDRINIEHLCNAAWSQVIKELDVDGLILATLCTKNKIAKMPDDAKIENVIYTSGTITLADQKSTRSFTQTYWDEYICFSLKHKISSTDVQKFEVEMKNWISERKPDNSKIRFVFMKDGHQIMEDSLDVEICSCHAMASAMATIVENSRNEQFKKQCLDMWHVTTSQQMNKQVYNHLILALENKIK